MKIVQWVVSLPRGRMVHVARVPSADPAWSSRLVGALCGFRFIGREDARDLPKCPRCSQILSSEVQS